MQVIQSMRFGDESDLFGKEKDDSFKQCYFELHAVIREILIYYSRNSILRIPAFSIITKTSQILRSVLW